MADNFDGSDQDEENEVPQEIKDAKLLEAVKNGDYGETEDWLVQGASAIVEKDGWNPLLWASCNGNEDIVRLLIRHNA